MTLNGVKALILHYFAEFDSFAGWLRHSVPVVFCRNWPTQQSHGLFVTAKLLVCTGIKLYGLMRGTQRCVNNLPIVIMQQWTHHLSAVTLYALSLKRYTC